MRWGSVNADFGPGTGAAEAAFAGDTGVDAGVSTLGILVLGLGIGVSLATDLGGGGGGSITEGVLATKTGFVIGSGRDWMGPSDEDVSMVMCFVGGGADWRRV